MNGSQFYITTGENLHSLDEKHTIFGEVAEGIDILEAIDSAPCDDDGRPLQNIRIRHTIILDDPLPDPRGLEDNIPDASPQPQVHALPLTFDSLDKATQVTQPSKYLELEQNKHVIVPARSLLTMGAWRTTGSRMKIPGILMR
jgi:hypothetical protein